MMKQSGVDDNTPSAKEDGDEKDLSAIASLLREPWPEVSPATRRSMAEEADAFFAFSKRLREQPPTADPDPTGARIPVDPPDPDEDLDSDDVGADDVADDDAYGEHIDGELGDSPRLRR